jgi:hypothetical protein
MKNKKTKESTKAVEITQIPEGTVEFTQASEERIWSIARVCHEANKTYCLTLDDESQPAWTGTEEWQRQSAFNGVKFRLENPNTTPEQMHESWMTEKIEQGWVYGETKNTSVKTHPCIVPYNELPASQQRKDKLFSAIVDALR